MARITLKQLAKQLNLSVGTVSKALKDYPDISATTKARVLELAEKLNFKPNIAAQSLLSNTTKTIGLIIPDIVNHFFSNIIKGVFDAADENGYVVMLFLSQERFDYEKRGIERFINRNVDGILLSMADQTTEYKHITRLIDKGIPLVLYDKVSKLVKCSKVIVDDIKAAAMATQHLIDIGCKKIAHIRGPLNPQTTIHRYLGYKRALKNNNIPIDNSLIYESNHLSFKDGYNLTDRILSEHPDVDGIFSFTDLVATGVLEKLKELKIKIPEQVAVIGYSNWFLTNVTSPKLSTIDQPGYLMGKTAFELLYKEMFTPRHLIKHQTIELDTSIIIRQSTLR